MLPPSNDMKKEKLKDTLLGLHWAATTGNVGLVKFALDHGVPIDSVVNGFVPLQLGCISDNNIAVVQYLIDRGADVNIQKWSKKHSADKSQAVPGARGSTALHVACANGCIKIVDLLLRNNARVDIKDKYGNTPLDVAYAKKEMEIIKLLKATQEAQNNPPDPKIVINDDDIIVEECSDKLRKPINIPQNMIHARNSSDKPHRIRRPSLPSISENNSHDFLHGIQPLINMTPSFTSNNVNKFPETSKRSLLVHGPSNEETNLHSCPTSPRNSVEYQNNLALYGNFKPFSRNTPSKSSYTSEDSSTIMYSISPQTVIFNQTGNADSDGQIPDWYGHGVINSYNEDNYLLSLERRAYNLSTNENGELERHSQEFRRSVENLGYYRQSISTGSSVTLPTMEVGSNYISNSLQNEQGQNSMDSNDNSVLSALIIKMKAQELIQSEEVKDKGYESGEDEDESLEEEHSGNELLPRPSIAIDCEADLVHYSFLNDQHHKNTRTSTETKRKWFNDVAQSVENITRKSLDIRPNFENLTNFAKRREPHTLNHQSDSSEQEEMQRQKTGFFSKWVPAWSKR